MLPVPFGMPARYLPRSCRTVALSTCPEGGRPLGIWSLRRVGSWLLLGRLLLRVRFLCCGCFRLRLCLCSGFLCRCFYLHRQHILGVVMLLVARVLLLIGNFLPHAHGPHFGQGFREAHNLLGVPTVSAEHLHILEGFLAALHPEDELAWDAQHLRLHRAEIELQVDLLPVITHAGGHCWVLVAVHPDHHSMASSHNLGMLCFHNLLLHHLLVGLGSHIRAISNHVCLECLEEDLRIRLLTFAVKLHRLAARLLDLKDLLRYFL